jgi:phosphate/sulfate permease
VAGNSTEAGRSVTSKITAILVTFTQGREHSLTELARLAELPVSTTHRLVSELTAQRLLDRTGDGMYRVGGPLRMIGQAVGGDRPSLTLRGATPVGWAWCCELPNSLSSSDHAIWHCWRRHRARCAVQSAK